MGNLVVFAQRYFSRIYLGRGLNENYNEAYNMQNETSTSP